MLCITGCSCCWCLLLLLLQALVQYPDEPTAEQAKDYLDGHCMYPGSKNKVHGDDGTVWYYLMNACVPPFPVALIEQQRAIEERVSSSSSQHANLSLDCKLPSAFGQYASGQECDALVGRQ